MQWKDDPRLGVTVWGRHFEHPLGLAAGFDKNAVRGSSADMLATERVVFCSS